MSNVKSEKLKNFYTDFLKRKQKDQEPPIVNDNQENNGQTEDSLCLININDTNGVNKNSNHDDDIINVNGSSKNGSSTASTFKDQQFNRKYPPKKPLQIINSSKKSNGCVSPEELKIIIAQQIKKHNAQSQAKREEIVKAKKLSEVQGEENGSNINQEESDREDEQICVGQFDELDNYSDDGGNDEDDESYKSEYNEEDEIGSGEEDLYYDEEEEIINYTCYNEDEEEECEIVNNEEEDDKGGENADNEEEDDDDNEMEEKEEDFMSVHKDAKDVHSDVNKDDFFNDVHSHVYEDNFFNDVHSDVNEDNFLNDVCSDVNEDNVVNKNNVNEDENEEEEIIDISSSIKQKEIHESLLSRSNDNNNNNKRRVNSKFIEDEAVESEDENYFGLGGIDEESDDNDDNDSVGSLKEMIVDETYETKHDDVARTMFNQTNLQEDREIVKNLYNQITTGAFRKRMREADGILGDDDDNDDDDNESGPSTSHHRRHKRKRSNDNDDLWFGEEQPVNLINHDNVIPEEVLYKNPFLGYDPWAPSHN